MKKAPNFKYESASRSSCLLRDYENFTDGLFAALLLLTLGTGLGPGVCPGAVTAGAHPLLDINPVSKDPYEDS